MHAAEHMTRDRAIVVDFTESLDYSDPAVGSLLFHIRRNIVEASSAFRQAAWQLLPAPQH